MMSVQRTIKLTQSNDQSITVSSGIDTFTIAFFEVPRVSDNAVRRFQRVRKPRTNVNETIENSPGPQNFRFTIYNSPTEDNAKDKKKEEQGSRSHCLAIKDDKAFAIRMVGDCNESAFKVKIRVGGVNILQHTTHGRKSQDYFVVSEQKWVWGKQVGKDTARQFRVFPRGRERLSLRYQLRNNNIRKEVEIEITSRRLDQPAGSCVYLPPPPTGMTSDGPGLSATYIPCNMPQQVHHSTPPPSLFDADHFQRLSSDDTAIKPQVASQELPSNDAGLSIPDSHRIVVPASPRLATVHEPDSEDFLADELFDTMPYGDTTPASLQGLPQAPQIHMSGPPSPADLTKVVFINSSDGKQRLFSNNKGMHAVGCVMAPPMSWSLPCESGSVPPEAPIHTPTEPGSPGHCSLSRRPFPSRLSLGSKLSLPSLPRAKSFKSKLPSVVSETPICEEVSVAVAAPQSASDQESIHSDREEDMIPHQMVVGIGGLIEQIVCPDKHPEWVDDDTVTLKFKIVGDPRHLPKHLQNLEEPDKRIRGTGPGGNYREVPNPPVGTFQALAQVVTDPDGLRRDIRSPMEMELSDDENRESPESPIDSGEESMGEREEGGRETENGGEEGNTRGFRELVEEAHTQPRGLMNNIQMKKKRWGQRKRGGVGIMAEKREEPKSERSSRWRKFVDALRRVLTLAR